MYLDFSKKLAFFHTPRTGGLSLLQLLNTDCNMVLQMGEHECMSELYSKYLYESEVLVTYYKFAFVRNPWDRLYSAFCHLNRGGINFTDTRIYNLYIQHYKSDFKEFVMSHHNWFGHKCSFIPYSYKSSPHFLPQTELLYNGPGMLLDFVGRFEAYEDSISTIYNHIGLRPGKLKRINTSRPEGSDYRLAYTDECAAVVSELYKDDIKNFGYTF